MGSVPQIDRNRIVSGIQERIPAATISVEDVNAEFGSWFIDIRHAGRLVSISWGPLSGFGATDHQDPREDSNPFGSHDWPLRSADEAIQFAVEHLSSPPDSQY